MTEEKKRGGARPGAGRKAGSVKDPESSRTQRLIVLVTPTEERLIKDAAKAAEMPLSRFLARKILEAI